MLKQIYHTALSAADKAAEVIMQSYLLPKITEFKGRTDLVTETDKRSEAIIIEEIQKFFPDHNILAEESGAQQNNSEYEWVIDPLDGTTNFVHGYPSFGVAIGVTCKNDVICGIVKELPANNTYSAVQGEGAFCNGKPINVSNVPDLETSLLVTGFSYNHDEKWLRNHELFKEFVDITQGVRRLGAAAIDLCHVASGKVDGFWEFDLKPWDTCAGVLIVREAGGIVTKMDGNEYKLNKPQLLATNKLIHNDMLKFTAPVINELKSEGKDL